jgi:5-methylcytosine-specific restriction endonuclease McrA
MTEEERKEHKRLNSQKWRDANKERHREYQRNYRKEHLEECRERNKKWDLEHPELVTGYKKKYTETHPGANNESSAKWRREHPEQKRSFTRQRRARVNNAEGIITPEEWLAVMELYGPACLCCGEVKPLTMDHIVPIFCGGTHTVGNVQPLCLSCNSSKGTKTVDYRPTLVV